MIDYRKILRLSAEGRGQREIERETLHSRHTISDALTAAQAAGISWPLDDDVTNEMIQDLLSPGSMHMLPRILFRISSGFTGNWRGMV